MGNVKIEIRDEDNRIVVQSGYHDSENVKAVPGARWDKDARVWTVPLSWAALLQLRGTFRERLEIGERLKELSWKVFENRVQPCLNLRSAQDCDFVSNTTLTPLQRVAVGFMQKAGQALNADPMGGGKTPCTITALRGLDNPFPALVVCPNSVKQHWKNEFEDWWSEIDVSVVTGNVTQRRKALEQPADVYIINWESLFRHSRLAAYGSINISDKDKEPKELNEMSFGTVIADECHAAKDPKSKRTRALWAVGDKAKYRFALTGTPIANTPEDLWSVMRFVSPEEYPSKSKWVERYALTSFNPFGAMEITGLRGDTRVELFGFLDPRMIRRPKEAILPQLEGKMPPVTREVDLAPKQRKAYNALKEEMLAELEGGTLVASNPMQKVGRLRQLAGATGQITEDGNVELTEPSSKIDDLVDVLEESQGDKVAIFAESRKLLELTSQRLTKEGVEHRLFTGQTSEQDREAARKEFQDGNLPVLLLTYGAGAEGINLSRADVQVYLERSWSAIKNSQAEERALRVGREGRLRTIDIVAADTVDQQVLQTYGDKLEMLEQVVRDKDALKTLLQ